MDFDEAGARAKDELIYDILKGEAAGEAARKDKINEEARGLVTSILVVVGFLLAAGTTAIVDIESILSILYFLGVSLMIISIILVFVVLRFQGAVSPSFSGHIASNDPTTDVERVLKDSIERVRHSIQYLQKQNRLKQILLTLTWLFLIVGLIAVMNFIIFSVISPD